MKFKDKSSIIISLFKRKGGEGFFTKIINKDNEIKYNYLYENLLLKEEKGLIIYAQGEREWLLLTNFGIHFNKKDVNTFILYSEIKEVKLPIEIEYSRGIVNKDEYTDLLLLDIKGNEYILKIEKGKPFWGVFQVLHYI